MECHPGICTRRGKGEWPLKVIERFLLEDLLTLLSASVAHICVVHQSRSIPGKSYFCLKPFPPL